MTLVQVASSFCFVCLLACLLVYLQGPSDIEYLRALLQRKGRSVLADYEATGMLSLTSRKLLVKIGVSDLIERKGFYPPSADKSRLARCMVNLFPSLKIRMEDENEGFEHFYDPISHNGFIEIRLRNIRRSLQDDQRRYQRKRGRTANASGGSIILEMPEEGEEAAAEWRTMIKRMRPSQENMAIIKEGMEKTYAHRRLWITSSSPTVEEIFAEYPRFVDMPNLVSDPV
ncbi:uncharacterized protein LOC134444550 [Engraulis encrasicolus]|uniref:uncharacterized protein LOC134444550 n=1 Tax=Engraulis encrasicolus TaxID=184585 RepID=UPI002FD78316